ncbi:MAG: hypothetical protein HY319_07360 [Armatimonadetes bacterium]|nr:hypothetical protein [Armatimonadota bacterium]
MRNLFLAICLWAAMFTGARAQEGVSPPDKAQLVGKPAEVTFRWTGTAKSYFLEVFYLNGAEVFRGDVAGNSKTLPVQTGPGYQWRVSLYKGGNYTPVLPLRTFQVVAPPSFHFNGAAGSSGQPGDLGRSGDPGGPGSQGQDITLKVERVGDSIRISMDPGGKSVLLLPSSGPIKVSARGGPGGSGGAGGRGIAGSYQRQYPQSDPPRYIASPAGPGGSGGPGGPGGRGGTVTVEAASRDLLRYVDIDVSGGAGGQGGAAGQAGSSPVPPYGSYPAPTAQDGSPGVDGPTGPEGRVVTR